MRPFAAARRPGLATRLLLHPSPSPSSTAAHPPSALSSLALPTRLRAFSTTPPQQSKTIKASRLPSRLIPPYPYGDRLVYKQSNRGLYGSARLQFGNLVAKKGLSKARRFWRPNVHVKNFYVAELDARVKTRLTLRVLKTIRREGGLLNYLVKSKPARVKEIGPSGWRLRWLVMQTRAVQERFNDQRRQLGLDPKPVVDNADLIHYAMDHATPGGLNVRSRATLQRMTEAEEDVFDLGDDIPEDAEFGQLLTDEAEDMLLKGPDMTQTNAEVRAVKKNIHV